MKVFEILDSKEVTLAEVSERLRQFDWRYEFSENLSRVSRGHKELASLERQVYECWKRNPEATVLAWNESMPDSPADKTTIPSFIINMHARERRD